MPSTPPKRTRSQRVATVELPPGRLASVVSQLRRGSVAARLTLAALAVGALLAMTRGWTPPSEFDVGDVPMRDVTARVEFRVPDADRTRDARERARRYAVAVYDNDPMPLTQLAANVRNEVTRLVGAESFDDIDPALWDLYRPPPAEGTPAPTEEELRADFDRFRDALATDEALDAFGRGLDDALEPLAERGLLERQPTDANAEQVEVRRSGKQGFESVVPVREVLIDNARNEVGQLLSQKLDELDVAQHVAARLRPDLPVTLRRNEAATRDRADRAADEVETVYDLFEPGQQLAPAGEPVTPSAANLLRRDYEAYVASRPTSEAIGRAIGTFWLFAAAIALCGLVVYRADPEALEELGRYTTMLGALLATVAAMLMASGQTWRLELVPLMLLGMTGAIAYRHQTALTVTATAAFVAAIGLGWSFGETIQMVTPAAAAIALLDNVRHRSKLLLVGFSAGLVAIATTLAVGSLEGEPLWPTLKVAVATGLWAVVAGSLMTCLLPAVERVFGVQTDLSLIELGDPAHPLLQELVRRAPGTYNHSITVASIAEAAADSIGARGLLVRVGAYFHDIGKMLKPGYFIENQGQGGNRHDTLVPAMSTLVIIAHVKDGADLARQNKLPQSIIDFIEQHHGTTLVEYFYRQAKKQTEANEDASEVDETRFRYPGPKPQTKETGVLMLADAVESASRALTEPTPARIESLVEDLIRKRLDDGQFDECGLTLREVHTIGESLIKSLNAVYHGRVKYPDQETA
ncbi:MAG: HDIG domain-containing metalloprotein [Planctomycetota bacterium]